MNENLHIIIYEGPAGSGKSTAIQRGLQLNLYRDPLMLAEVPRPRQYIAGAGTNLSQLKDYLRTLGAFSTLQNDPSGKPIVFDRWAVSQFVYHSIRLKQEIDPFAFCYGYMSQMFSNFLGAASENLWRHFLQFNLPAEFNIYLDFYFIVPMTDALSTARARKGPGYYPYPLEEEVERYLTVMDAWENYLGFDTWRHRSGVNYRAQRFPAYLPPRKLDEALRATVVLGV